MTKKQFLPILKLTEEVKYQSANEEMECLNEIIAILDCFTVFLFFLNKRDFIFIIYNDKAT